MSDDQGRERSKDVSEAEQSDAHYLDAINPRTGKKFSLIVRQGKTIVAREYGMARARELTDLVPEVVQAPRAVFQGVRDRRERKWLCYCGLPSRAFDQITAARIAPWPNKVFLVFTNERLVIYNWYWSLSDPEHPHLPEDHEERFYKRLF